MENHFLLVSLKLSKGENLSIFEGNVLVETPLMKSYLYLFCLEEDVGLICILVCE